MIRRIICKNNIINKNVRHVVKKYNVASKTTTTLFNKKRIMVHNNNNLNKVLSSIAITQNHAINNESK